MRLNKRFVALAALIGAIAALSMVASAAITTTINPANAPSGTHVQTGTIGCTLSNGGLTVSCSTFELAGVGHTNAILSYQATYTATIDCFNKGVNPQNPIESHQATLTEEAIIPLTSSKNGRLRVPAVGSSPSSVADESTCPNPNWTPVIREGTLQLVSFTYSLTFEGFTQPYILITGP